MGEENRAGTVVLREASGWPVGDGHLGLQGSGEGEGQDSPGPPGRRREEERGQDSRSFWKGCSEPLVPSPNLQGELKLHVAGFQCLLGAN